MGLSNALNTAVSGLTSHQKALDNIGNNLANVNTVGFKKGVYQFSTLLEQTLRGGMGSTGTTGSVNPIALGFGTQTGSINKVFTQGNIETTGNGQDMAIDGNGFFVVKSGNMVAYTRDGSFAVDEDGNLINSMGLYVQGTMAVKNSDGSITIPQDTKLENINIPIGTIGGMQKTSTVAFAGNLNYTQNNVAGGLNLYGSVAVPSVDSLQEWMSSNQNTTDETWSALQEATYYEWTADSTSAVNPTSFGYVGVGGTVMTIDEAVLAGYALEDSAGNPIVAGSGALASLASIQGLGLSPMIREVNTINGGNVQTSQAMGITVPAYDSSVANGLTYPEWYYQSTGSALSYEDIVAENDALRTTIDQMTAIITDPGSTAAEIAAAEDAIDAAWDSAIRTIWSNGFNGADWDSAALTSASLPRSGTVLAASLNTPLEHVYTYENGKWNQLFTNLQEGDEITVAFDKGDTTISATFVYNYPVPQSDANQVALDYEKSYTLEHFLTFLGGDVNQTAAVCADISLDMFDGDVEAYNQALADLTLAKSSTETGGSTGVMGLVDVAPMVTVQNGGTDTIDAPLETAGAYTREGVTQVNYTVWDEATQSFVTGSAGRGDSFNVSLVSNLGTANALSNIQITHNDVTNRTLFSNETEYASTDGGSTTASITFYDSLGNAHTATVRMTLVSEDSNFSTWRWYAECQDDTDFTWQADPATGDLVSSLNSGTGLFRFDSDGNFVRGSDYSETGGIVINLENQGVDDTIHVAIQNGLSSKQTQDLDFSAFTYSAAATRISLSEQNGSPPGSLTSFEVATDGTVYGVYSTGKTVRLARLVLATVANENGLRAGANNLYYTTPASGEAQYGYPQDGGRGDILQYNLETSNVEMSEEFTKMISIERGYQANSRVVSVADEMLQELLSMVR